MPLKKLPVVGLDDVNHRRRARETINQVLDHSFDDSRVQTTAEKLAGVTPVNYAYAPGYLKRATDNATPGTTDVSDAIQRIVDSASQLSPNFSFSEQAGLSRPIVIKTTTTQGISIIGDSRAASVLQPLSVSIATAPQNINCCIFNANNNSHFHLEHVEFFAVAAWTGVGIYCVEGGGADASGQALFSAVLRDIFFVPPSTNGGFCTGALQNSVVDTCVYESAKGVFNVQGVGNADNHYTNQSLYNCFDHYILQTADTNGSQMLTVNGLHAYSHNRGILFEVKNWDGCQLNNITLEPASGNLGSVGVGKFTDCTNLLLTHITSRVRSGVPAGETILEFSGSGSCSAKVSHSILTGTRAVKVSSTGSGTLEFDDVDFSTAGSSCFDVAANFAGTIITRNCKFNNAQIRGMVHSSAATLNWFSYGDEFINGGLGGLAASRNIDITTTGTVVLYNPRIGRDSGSAAAGYYIEAGGSGTVTIIHPIIVGTPPTGIKTGTQTVRFVFTPGDGGTIASAAAISLPYFGDSFVISGTTNITSITTGIEQLGRTIRLQFLGALTFTDGSNLKLNGNFVTTADDVINLVCSDGINWYEVSRSAN